MSSFRDRPLQVDGTAAEVIQALKLEPRIMRYELSEYDWSGVKPMLPNKPRGVPRVNDRRVRNGILWVLRSGAPWCDLPENFGPYTCYNRFVRWRRYQIMEALAAAHDGAVTAQLALRPRKAGMSRTVSSIELRTGEERP